jgi:hypothetical protein
MVTVMHLHLQKPRASDHMIMGADSCDYLLFCVGGRRARSWRVAGPGTLEDNNFNTHHIGVATGQKNTR